MQEQPDTRWDGVLLAEAVRLLEDSGAVLEGAVAATTDACAGGGDLEARIIRRARALPVAEQLRIALGHMRAARMLAIVGAVVLAAAAGGGAAQALLTRSDAGPINVFHALAVLLGLPVVMLCGWLILMVVVPRSGTAAASAGLLGRGVFALAGRVSRWLDGGPVQLSVVRATAKVLGTSTAGKWWASAASHLFWLAYLGGAFAVLLLMFSTREYTFDWETTILAEHHYVLATQALAALPSWLGFPVPDAAMVAASGKAIDAAVADGARQAWAGLLMGAVAAYGILPRLVALVLTLIAARRATNRIHLDTGQPGFARLRPLLMPVARQVGVVDAEQREGADARVEGTHAPPVGREGAVAVLGLEIDPPASGWPPAVTGPGWLDLGFVNDRTDRHRVIDRLATSTSAPGESPRAVLIVCALPVTPDRGHRAFIDEVQRRTGLAVLMLLTGGQRLRDRGQPQSLAIRVHDWRELARAAGVADERIIDVDLDNLTGTSDRRLAAWLAAGGADGTAGSGEPASIAPAFATIVDHVGRWRVAPGDRERLALQQAIAGLYREAARSWPERFRVRLKDGVADVAGLTSAADRVVDLLPARLRLNPRWLGAGALAGALGCLAAAALVAPVAIASLPAWAGIGAVVAGVLERTGASKPTPAVMQQDFGEPVAAAALYALLLHLQGRDEATITRLLDHVLDEDDVPAMTGAAAAEAWLDAVHVRLDTALAQEEGVR